MKTHLLAALLCALSISPQAVAEPSPDLVKRPMEIQQKLNAAYLAKGVLYRPRTEHLNPDGSPVYTNRLILEDSPYLLQHAHNPVDWYAWGEEAFAKAKRENKPVFLSIGYSTCHWCHVMERESFENTQIAEFINQHFIAIKVDRESHPDVDEVYMTAVMLMSGHGGWPMSSFLTPDGKPIFGGTYYPPQAFFSLLQQIRQLWEERRNDVLDQAQRVAEAVEANNSQRLKVASLDPEIIGKAAKDILGGFDELQGGFSQAPKFPREPWLYLLLNQAERHRDSEVLQALEITLDAMARGGIYDQVGGGFHRYSTDNEWLVPHFEKMLYNQAHLARIYLLAWRLTGKPQYRRVATQTLDYVVREMTAPGGGFYSATDADSEGEEGTFFIWSTDEIRQALTEADAELAISVYGVSKQGNFEGRNILHLSQGLEETANQQGIAPDELYRRIDGINRKLREVREKREHPLRDDKIVTAWNGMMVSAFAQAAELLDSAAYRQAAEGAAGFLWDSNRMAAGRLWRVHLDGKSSVSATQEDYAYLAEGLLHLYDMSADKRWLERARELVDAMLERFFDKNTGSFYMNEADAGVTAMSRPLDGGTDNAIASGSSVALRVLQKLWVRTGHLDYRSQAEALIAGFAGNIARHPSSYAYMLTGIDDLKNGELSAQGFAAQGGIRLSGSLKTLGADKQLLNLAIEIPAGWHINSNKPKSQDLIPTELELGDQTADWRLAPVTYPQPKLQTLAFQSEPLAVYEGRQQLQALVESNKQGRQAMPLAFILTLQACNNEVCLPPEQVTLRVSPSTNPE